MEELTTLDKLKNYELELKFMDNENFCHEVAYVMEELSNYMGEHDEVHTQIPQYINLLMLLLSTCASEAVQRLWNLKD